MTAIGAALCAPGGDANARLHHRHHGAHFARHSGDYEPPYAAIVVDANSGHVLEAANPDSPRHPASVTKVMTLYLLFEQLETGKLRLDSRLPVSPHAAAQDPSKLGLEPGQTITVEDAIKAVVTKSANDVAVVIAEAIGGTEDNFARMMTRKARALGMTRTTYVNASGLPNDDQITTARDQALLGRAVHDRFPRYYRYFSTLTFHYHGGSIRNHNHLLGRVDGVDGIKTGFTRASGFNLLCSVHRGDRHIVAVVMGGSSGQARDARMRSLIEQHISEASTQRTVAAVAEVPEESPVWQGKIRLVRTNRQEYATDTQADGRVNARMLTTGPVLRVGSAEPIQPIQVKTVSFRPATVRPAAAPGASVAQQASMPIQASSVAQQSASVESRRAVPMAAQAAQVPTGHEAEAEAIAGPPPPARAGLLGTLTYHVPQYGAAEHATVVAAPAVVDDAASRPASARGGYMIQLGAFADESEAKARLRTAQSMAQDLLGNADPFTERVVKGSREFYRARFAGLDKDAAEAACQYFHRNDIACMALRSN